MHLVTRYDRYALYADAPDGGPYYLADAWGRSLYRAWRTPERTSRRTDLDTPVAGLLCGSQGSTERGWTWVPVYLRARATLRVCEALGRGVDASAVARAVAAVEGDAVHHEEVLAVERAAIGRLVARGEVPEGTERAHAEDRLWTL